MIKIYSSLTLWAFIFTNFFSVNIARASEETDTQAKKLFIVTAYYSPLPDQKVYLRWSYEADIKLNWAWIAWASWKKVFPGMLAAPKSYSFWTKVFLEWFWVWEVADRWWAIITLENWETKVDRIDIWMWKWEEGLKRALSWWKRKIYGYNVANATDVNIDLAKFPAPDSAIKNLASIKKETWILSENIWVNSPQEDIKELQKTLKEMWLFSWDIDWVYSDSLKKVVRDYQLKEWLIDSASDIRAWYTWVKTRASLKANLAIYKKKNREQIELVKKEDERQKKLAQAKKEKETKLAKEINKKVDEHLASIWKPENGEISSEVRNLQKTMKLLWYFTDKDTAIFWEKTKQAVINYQIDKWIIDDTSSKNAWVVDNKTLAKLKEDLTKKIKSQINNANEKLVSINM
jgi:peptidoglycan hydrolase-like protein with peptidoglycan-binding domain